MPYRTKALVVSPCVATLDYVQCCGTATIFYSYGPDVWTSPGSGSATLDCVWAEIYRIVCQKSALSPGDMEETIRPSGLEAINVKEGRAPPHQYAVGGADPRILIFSSRIQA